ncbi:MAG: zf-HC2 domain-containing protein [Bryobacterales bacterium]|nr:zf-HC2 domain-containing protein [Bryobacterales bacterium]
MKAPDLEAYVLGELTEAERVQVERHLATHPEAAAEVERLQLVTGALRRLPEEEPPRRIAFVSDKVFEPNWLQRFWNSAPRLAFGCSAMLAAAILGHGVLARPAQPVAAAVHPREVSRQIEAEVGKRLEAAITKAVTQVRAEEEGKSKVLVRVALDDAEKRFALARQADRATVDANFELLRKQMNRMVYLASNQEGAGK